MSVHGSELKCKYLIKVNPGQVNKPGTHKDRERNTARCRGRTRDGDAGWRERRGSRRRARYP